MELKLLKKDFSENYLNILSKAIDIVAIKANKDGLYAVCNKPDTSIIILGKYKINKKYNKCKTIIKNNIGQGSYT